MPGHIHSQTDIRELLQALDRQLGEAARLSTAAHIDAARQRFATYRQFRDKVGEFQTLAVVIQNRFRNLNDPDDTHLVEFERLETRMLMLLIRASMRFFLALADNDVLPLGARDVFLSELRTLHETHETLSSPRYEAQLDASVRADLALAQKILADIIEKAPALLQFESA